MTLIARKIKSFRKIFTKEEQLMIILTALVGIVIGVFLMVLGIKIMYAGIGMIITNTDKFLIETFGFGLY